MSTCSRWDLRYIIDAHSNFQNEKLFSRHAYGSVPLSIMQLETYDDTFLSADSELIGKGEEIWWSEVDGSKDEPQF
jgi:hypothetical protein